MNIRPTCQLVRQTVLKLRPSIRYNPTPELTTIRQRRFAGTSPPNRVLGGGGAESGSSERPKLRSATLLTTTAGLALSLLLFYHTTTRPIRLDAPVPGDDDDKTSPPDTSNLPRFRLEEIRKHNGESPNPWVIHGNKVYDITDWVPAHPGGDVILRAAGGSIDRYWDIFTIHKTQYIYDILATYLIGCVDPADLTPDGSRPAVSDEVADPFSDDPKRHPDLITHTEKPRNAETPAYALDGSFLTPNDLFYVRNHMWVPTIDRPDDHTVTIELADGSTRAYTVRDLKERFPHRSVTAVLQCSGNRRDHMSKGSGRKANGLPWGTGAISNAQWEGVLLADVLADAGFSPSRRNGGGGGGDDGGGDDDDNDDNVQHVHFSGMEAYGSSIPIHKAMDPRGDVLLAWGMNGQPLPRDHGYPLRSIVPGTVAARSVKWLKNITLSDEESPAQWQRRDYKCFGPNETQVDWESAPSIQEMPVQSAITSVRLGDAGSAQGRTVSLGGYAYSGGGHAIVRVDVSVDDGATWSRAELLPDGTGSGLPSLGHRAWSWKRWRFNGVIPTEAFMSNQPRGEADGGSAQSPRRCTQVVVKAVDDAYNTQPEGYGATWNIRGNLTSAWHRVLVCTDCPSGVVKKA